MIACQKIIWEFGKLQTNAFTKHPLPYSISDPQRILGILDFIFAECEQQLE